MTEPIALAYMTFTELAKALQQLTEEQFCALSEGRARIELHFDGQVVSKPIKATKRAPKTGATAASLGPLTAEQAADTIRNLRSSEEVLAYLKGNERALTKDKLGDLAARLGPTVALRSKGNKDQWFEDIVAGTAGYREQSAVMLPGGFQR